MEKNTEFGAAVDALRPIIGMNGALSGRILAKAAGVLDKQELPMALHLLGDTCLLHANPAMADVLGVTTYGVAAAVALPAWLITDAHASGAVRVYLDHFGWHPREPFALPVLWPQAGGVSTCRLWLAQGVGTTLKRPVVLSALVPLSASGAVSPLSARIESLLPREREVTRLFCQGRKVHQVATALGISPQTVRTHRRNILAKLGLGDVFGLLGLCTGKDI